MSPLQGQLFTTPFEQSLDLNNRWIKLARQLDWDILAKEYHKCFNADFGAPAVNARVVIGAVVIKHLLHLTDEDTITTIQENLYIRNCFCSQFICLDKNPVKSFILGKSNSRFCTKGTRRTLM